MGTRKWANQLTCLNCGAVVHWTDFQCDFCGRNPREKESIIGISLPQGNLVSPVEERRKHPRYDFHGEVILNRYFKGELLDLCQRGAKLKTLLRLFRDEVVHLDFTIKGIPIQVKARVIHVKQGVLDERFTMGVFFEDIAEGHSEVLNHHLKGISEESARPEYFA